MAALDGAAGRLAIVREAKNEAVVHFTGVSLAWAQVGENFGCVVRQVEVVHCR